MDKTVKTSNKIFKGLIFMIIVILILGLALYAYNKSKEKQAIELIENTASKVFNASVEYSKNSNRIIVEKYLENEKELYELTKTSLPKLSPIGDYDIVDLLSVRAYYGESKDDFQFYDIAFKDINKIRWETIKNFDDFLNEISRFK
jgi:hypothetical protein